MIIDSFKGKYAFLSNFYPAMIVYKDQVYPTVEHAYQAAKTSDASWMHRIQHCETAAAAKHLGRRAPIRYDWEFVKVGIMLDLLRLKFQPGHPDLLAVQLAGTNPHELVEGNTWGDTFWGVCDGKGENHLGKLLMMVRGEVAHQLRSKPAISRIPRFILDDEEL